MSLSPDAATLGAEPGPALRVRVLGGFDVRVGGRSLGHADWERTAAERLAKLLFVTPGHRVNREVAAETLWPDLEPAAARASLRKALHFASRALADSGAIGTDAWSIWIESDRLELDLDALEAALRRLSERSTMSAGEERDEDDAATVVRLGREDLLPEDVYEDWLVGPRERMRGRWQRVTLAAARRARERGDRERAHELVEELLERDPADDAAHRLAIELYVAEGRRSCAVRQFEQYSRELAGLGAEPSAEARGLIESLPVRASLAGERDGCRRAGNSGDEQLATVVIKGRLEIGGRPPEELLRFARAIGWQILRWQPFDAQPAAAS